MDELSDFCTKIDVLLNDLKEERLRLRMVLQECEETLMGYACERCDWRVDKCWRLDGDLCQSIKTVKRIREVLAEGATVAMKAGYSTESIE